MIVRAEPLSTPEPSLPKTTRLSARSRWRRWILFPAMLLLATLVLAEIAARIWLFMLAPAEWLPRYALASEVPSAVKYAPHPYRCYGLRPQYERRGATHNELGFRGPLVKIPKPAGVYRILALGGSTTYGEFIDRDDQTWTARLQAELRSRLGTEAIEVVNAGCPGYNSWESAVTLLVSGLDFEPDLILMGDGLNDVHCRLVPPALYASDNRGRRQVWADPLDVVILRYSLLGRIAGYHLGVWNNPGIDSFVGTPHSDPGAKQGSQRIGGEPLDLLAANPPVYFERNLRSMIALARAHGAKAVLLGIPLHPGLGDYAATPHYQQAVREHHAVLDSLSAELAVPRFRLEDIIPAERPYWRDGRHVSATGAALQARVLAEFLIQERVIEPVNEPVLEQASPAPSAPKLP